MVALRDALRLALVASVLASASSGGAAAPSEQFAAGRVVQLTLDTFDAELAKGPYLVYVGTRLASAAGSAAGSFPHGPLCAS
jgi:hypothetical protein